MSLMPRKPLRLLGLLALAPLLTACLEKENLLYVPDAENLLFTQAGDLLITGGESIQQLVSSDGGQTYQGRLVSPPGLSKCNYTGMAQVGDWVFAACVETKWLVIRNNHLLAANVSQPGYRFDYVVAPSDTSDPLDTLSLPNGLAVAPDGALLIADSNFLGVSGVARATLSVPTSAQYQANPALKPRLMSFQKNWLGTAHGLTTPNGLRVDGQRLYLSDGGALKRFEFDAQGQIPAILTDATGAQQVNQGATLWKSSLTVLDDLLPYCNGVLFADFLGGQIRYVTSAPDPVTGQETFVTLYSSPLQSFASPSSLAIGKGPMFSAKDLLVTEKGILFNSSPAYGNELVRIKLPASLADPDACEMIAEEARQRLAGG